MLIFGWLPIIERYRNLERNGEVTLRTGWSFKESVNPSLSSMLIKGISLAMGKQRPPLQSSACYFGNFEAARNGACMTVATDLAKELFELAAIGSTP
jgi:hypothetical protein